MAIVGFGESLPPQGAIVMWDEPLANIPAGWVLCDGNNGTPNFLGKTPKHVSATESPGDSGGEGSITLTESQLPAHNHDGPTDESGTHRHRYERTGGVGSDSGEDFVGGGDWYVFVNSAGNHTHTVNSVDNTGGGASIDNIPLSYQVAYIMKL